MIQAWETEELHEHISQGVLLLSKLLIFPDDVELRNVCEAWIKEHKSYLPDEPSGYDKSEIDNDENKWGF